MIAPDYRPQWIARALTDERRAQELSRQKAEHAKARRMRTASEAMARRAAEAVEREERRRKRSAEKQRQWRAIGRGRYPERRSGYAPGEGTCGYCGKQGHNATTCEARGK